MTITKILYCSNFYVPEYATSYTNTGTLFFMLYSSFKFVVFATLSYGY